MMFIRLWVFFAGVLATLFLGWAALVGVPGIQIAAVPPQPGPAGPTRSSRRTAARSTFAKAAFTATRSRRAPKVSAPTSSAAGAAPSVPGDYFYDRPHLLGTMRTGPDLLNIGVRQPSRDWHLAHLYNPRSVVPKSVMPPFPWLFEEKTSTGPNDVVVDLPAEFQPRPGVSIVATARPGPVEYSAVDEPHVSGAMSRENRHPNAVPRPWPLPPLLGEPDRAEIYEIHQAMLERERLEPQDGSRAGAVVGVGASRWWCSSRWASISGRYGGSFDAERARAGPEGRAGDAAAAAPPARRRSGVLHHLPALPPGRRRGRRGQVSAAGGLGVGGQGRGALPCASC